MLTEAGKKMLEERFGASDFELDPHTGFFDARFQIDEVHLEMIFKQFWLSTVSDYEHDPTLDILAELAGEEESGHEGILTDEETKSAKLVFMKSVRQKPSYIGSDTSSRASIPTRRLFRVYELVLPLELFNKFHRSSLVKILNNTELATTDGGSKAGRTSDGFVIQNNLFLL